MSVPYGSYSDTRESTNQLLVQIASYNTNLQGLRGLPQDLVDWLSPTLQVSNFLSRERRAPDIVAVGFQELLPLHLGLCGFSKAVISDRGAHILSQIQAHAPNKERYSLVAKVVNVGVALLVYALDDGVARKVRDVETQWASCGPLYMGNKGAVGVRFRVPSDDGGVGETFTFVCAHLTAHEPRLAERIADYNHVVSSLLFSPIPASPSKSSSTVYDSSHLFFLGDLNFRLSLPKLHPLAGVEMKTDLVAALEQETLRAELKEYDQLLAEKRNGNVCVALREGDFWGFKPSYKYEVGEVDKYSLGRTPSWTDRILYATHSDSADTLETSNITNILYTSIPSYINSDHKPIVSLLLLPPALGATGPSPPTIQLPSTYVPTPDPNASIKRLCGRLLDRFVGIIWWLFTVIGAGSLGIGLFNLVVGIGAWRWWRSSQKPPSIA